MRLFNELKRRNVIKVAMFYGIGSWVVLQVADVLFDALGLPDWSMKLVLGLLVLGFVPVLVFSWVYEMTPEGLRKEAEIDQDASITAHTGRKLNLAIVVLLVLGLGVLLADRFLPRQAPPPVVVTGPAAVQSENSIAVLPFSDLSPNGDQGYFADGIAEEILNVLAKVDALKVASRTSSFAFKGEEMGIPEIAAALKVRTILEGSVRKAGDRVRITAQLIDTRNDRHLWSETYDRELTDIFAIQDEIANDIVAALKTTLGVTAQPVHVAVATENPDAYELFLKGRQLFLDRVDLPQAIASLEQAVALDPKFVRAWETLAAVYSVALSWRVPGESFFEKSVRAADRALALEPERGFPYAIKATLALNTLETRKPDWEEIMSWHDLSIDRDPKNATVWLWRGIARRLAGDFAGSRSDLKQCLALDPAYQNCRAHMMMLDLASGHPEAALAWLDHQLTEVRNRYTVYYAALVPLLVERGQLRAARLMADDASMGFNGNSQAIESWIQALLHPDSESARSRLADAIPTNTSGLAPPPILIAGGRYHQLQPAFGTINVMWQPGSRRFRQSPDFKRIIAAINLQPYWRAHGFPPQCRPLGDEDFECD